MRKLAEMTARSPVVNEPELLVVVRPPLGFWPFYVLGAWVNDEWCYPWNVTHAVKCVSRGLSARAWQKGRGVEIRLCARVGRRRQRRRAALLPPRKTDRP